MYSVHVKHRKNDEKKRLTVCRVVKNDSKKLKHTYILRISIAIRCNVSKKNFFSMITLNTRALRGGPLFDLYLHDQVTVVITS